MLLSWGILAFITTLGIISSYTSIQVFWGGIILSFILPIGKINKN
jgi:hypothetical protein